MTESMPAVFNFPLTAFAHIAVVLFWSMGLLDVGQASMVIPMRSAIDPDTLLRQGLEIGPYDRLDVDPYRDGTNYFASRLIGNRHA